MSPHRPIDLRSDTVTRPTQAMRAAMAAAEVGDDVYGEDPTVRALEERVADLFGHEAAVFVPSGTMGNQIALRLVVPSAGELLCDADAHVVTYEHGGAAQHGGIQSRTVAGGLMSVEAVAAELRPAGWGTVPTAAVSVEQTHNRGGGAVHPLDVLQGLRALTRDASVLLHCDGARIWNAAVATGVALSSYGGLFDTLSVCLSKGLGAPVGSVVVCEASRAEQARVLRKRLGGGMRQAGVLAAAGLHALDHHVERLAEDHARAARLADALGAGPVETNLVPLAVDDARALAATAAEQGVLISVTGPQRVRLVTHLDVDDAGVERAIEVVAPLLA
ncbi:MAG: GntG family PLP-dependent aldolase [Mycobacteriales bacterium]|nr:GntG family PLP-dependent aldolase [Mycobacteriales bacterium]